MQHTFEQYAAQVAAEIAAAYQAGAPNKCIIVNDCGTFTDGVAAVASAFDVSLQVAASMLQACNAETHCDVVALAQYVEVEDEFGCSIDAYYLVALPCGAQVSLHCNNIAYIEEGNIVFPPIC